jgi:hypothetical protein
LELLQKGDRLNEPEFAAIPTLRAYTGVPEAAPLRGFMYSGIAHLVFLVPLVVSSQLAKIPREVPPPRTVVRLFLPKQAPTEAERPKTVLSTSEAAFEAAPDVAPPLAKVPVDMSAIELSFAADTGNQLPEVIRQQRGVLALVDKTDPTIARYMFEPPQWAFHPGIVDISDKVRFAMYPPEKWAAVGALAAAHGLQLDQYEVCALFEANYTGCLRDAISSRATSDPRGAGARVKSARLAFSAASPCGIDVLEVSFAAIH